MIKKRNLDSGLLSYIDRRGNPFEGTRRVTTDVQKVFYVDSTNGSDNWLGESWQYPLASIGKAITNIGTEKFCTIYVAPGDYLITAVIPIVAEGTKIIGAGDRFRNVSMIYASSADFHLMTINAHHVELYGLAFSSAGDSYDAIRTSTTASYYKIRIEECRFDGWSGEYGIHTGSTYDSPDIVVVNNLFRSWNTAAIYSNATRGNYINNIFHVTSGKIGIDHQPSGSSRPDNVYIKNYFSGVTNTGTTAIKLSNAPNDGACIIADNRMAGTFDVNITQSAKYICVENYEDDGSGSAVVDGTT